MSQEFDKYHFESFEAWWEQECGELDPSTKEQHRISWWNGAYKERERLEAKYGLGVAK